MGKIQKIIDALYFIIREDGRRNSNFHRLESKVDAIIEWILNDHPLLNKSYRDKLEHMLGGNLRYYKDSSGNTLRTEVIS